MSVSFRPSVQFFSAVQPVRPINVSHGILLRLHVTRVAHVGAALVGAAGVTHLDGVDAVLARVELFLSEFPFVFLRDFRSDLRSVVLGMVLRLTRQGEERHRHLRNISLLEQIASLENLLVGDSVRPDSLLKGGDVFHEGEVAGSFLGGSFHGTRLEFVDEFAENQSIAQEILVRLLGRLHFASQLGDPIQHLLLQFWITGRHCEGR